MSLTWLYKVIMSSSELFMVVPVFAATNIAIHPEVYPSMSFQFFQIRLQFWSVTNN
jgi:hypothetical protein